MGILGKLSYGLLTQKNARAVERKKNMHMSHARHCKRCERRAQPSKTSDQADVYMEKQYKISTAQFRNRPFRHKIVSWEH